jgi:hypothetical protein
MIGFQDYIQVGSYGQKARKDEKLQGAAEYRHSIMPFPLLS